MNKKATCMDCKKELTEFESLFNVLCVNSMIKYCTKCLSGKKSELVVNDKPIKSLINL